MHPYLFYKSYKSIIYTKILDNLTHVLNIQIIDIM